MRARNVKPGFFKNELLAKIDPLGRILFSGLWCLGDREGRLEDRPERIKAEVLPYDSCDPELLLCQLNDKGFILRYETNGNKYIQILNFLKHQTPHCKESASTIPAPNQHKRSTRQTQYKSKTKPVSAPPDSLIPDSLIPDSLIPDSLIPSSSANSSFEVFWNTYPKKKSKGQAEKAWSKIKPDEQLLEKIFSTIERAKTSVEWTKDGGQFIPHPATWLNARGWEDEYTPQGIIGPQPGITSWLKKKIEKKESEDK